MVGANVLATIVDSERFVKNAIPNDKKDGSSLRYVGILDDRINVFYNSSMDSNEVLCGYRGSSDIDVGYVYAPYITMVSKGVAINPKTFEPVLSFMTRYGKISFAKSVTETSKDDEGRDVKTSTQLKNDYYQTITFENINKEDEDSSFEKIGNLF